MKTQLLIFFFIINSTFSQTQILFPNSGFEMERFTSKTLNIYSNNNLYNNLLLNKHDSIFLQDKLLVIILDIQHHLQVMSIMTVMMI